MKKLYLLRHAEARPNCGQDISRYLSAEGEEETAMLAKIIRKKGRLACDAVFSSSAIRAHQTWGLIESAVKTKKPAKYFEELYRTSAQRALYTISELNDSYNSVLIISHNPALSDLASSFTGKKIYFKTGMIKLFEVDITSWKDIGFLCAKQIWSLPH